VPIASPSMNHGGKNKGGPGANFLEKKISTRIKTGRGRWLNRYGYGALNAHPQFLDYRPRTYKKIKRGGKGGDLSVIS